MSYRAPLRDMLFCLKELAGLPALSELPGFEDAGLDTAAVVLAECAKFNEAVTAPLNHQADHRPGQWQDGTVTTAPGFKEAFRQFVNGGWQGVQHPLEYGGQGLPKVIGAACREMLYSANLSLSLCPLLTDGAIEALLTAGSERQKAQLIPKLIDGSWTGTMNLTEPQAGSDLSLVRTKALPDGDGTYRISGEKIFITFGEHDMAENILHLVLARVPGAPLGIKGISLFLVPKFLVNADGSLGARNDVYCASIEHKLGIKASPTAAMVYGSGKGQVGSGAIGYLLGEENRGLEYMFVMMNIERFAVGMQGVAITERAYQKAVQYARERTQSRPADGSLPAAAPIIHHPDVRRLLMTMRAYAEAGRAMALAAASLFDIATNHPEQGVRQENLALYEFLVPLVKGYCTETSLEATSMGVQIHGGMGFVEETGAAQYYRDARILTIYEGTTAIQANDLVARKTARDGGRIAKELARRIMLTEAELGQRQSGAALAMRRHLTAARLAFESVLEFVVSQVKQRPNAVYAGSVPYLMLAGNMVAGWQMARALLAAEACLDSGQERDFMVAKIATAHFYAQHVLATAPSLCKVILEGGDSVMALPIDAF